MNDEKPGLTNEEINDDGFQQINMPEKENLSDETNTEDRKEDQMSVATKSKPFSLRKAWNIFLAAAVVFLIAYLGFFSDSSVMRGVAYQRTIDSLKACIEQQQDSLNYYRTLNRRLSTDPSLTEQVVREQYNMKRDNEDIYVFKKQ